MKHPGIVSAIAGFSVAGVLAIAAYVAAPSLDEAPDEEQALEQQLKRMPRDGRSWILLARLRMDWNRYDSAVDAYQRGLDVSPKVAADPQVWCELADALGMAQGGSLKGKPRQLIDKALVLNPNHPRALEMAGSAEYEGRNYAEAASYWERLLPKLRAGSAEQREVSAAIERARERAGAGTPAS